MVPSLLFRSPSFLAHIGYCLHWSESSSIKNCRALSLMMKKEQTLTLDSSKVCNMCFFIGKAHQSIQSNPKGKFDFYTSKMLKTFSFNPLQKSWENHGSFSLFYGYFPFPLCMLVVPRIKSCLSFSLATAALGFEHPVETPIKEGFFALRLIIESWNF